MLQAPEGSKGTSARAGSLTVLAQSQGDYLLNHFARSAGGRYGAWRRIG